MSSSFMSDFFPDLTNVLRTQYPSIWNHIFPQTLQEQCPELQYVWQHQVIRSPYLLPIAFAAGICGFMGFIRNRTVKRLAFCRFGCLFFGMMNFSAIAAHCLLERGSMPWRAAVSIDVCCTGCSGTLLAMGMYFNKGHAYQNLLIAGVITAIIGGYSVANELSIPFRNEFAYLGVTSVAGAAVAVLGLTSHVQTEAMNSYSAACIGAVVALLSLTLDRHMCAFFGSSVNLSHILFAGCLVIIYNLERYMAKVAAKDKVL